MDVSYSEINEKFQALDTMFDYKQEKNMKDYNYEVDALEDEHVRRGVHTTKTVLDLGSEAE